MNVLPVCNWQGLLTPVRLDFAEINRFGTPHLPVTNRQHVVQRRARAVTSEPRNSATHANTMVGPHGTSS